MKLNIMVHNRYRIGVLRANRRGRTSTHTVPSEMTTQRAANYRFTDAVDGAELYIFPVADRRADSPLASLPSLPQRSRERTNNQGVAKFDVPLNNGQYVLRIRPAHWTIAPVGPSLDPTFTTRISRIFRPLDVLFTVAGDPENRQITTAIAKGGQANGEVTQVLTANNTIKVILQPVWVTDYTGRRRTRSNGIIDLIVIHQTTGEDPYGMFSKAAAKEGAHYLILKGDGQIVKFNKDENVGDHGGGSWQGDTNPNLKSIGIELENSEGLDFSEPQYKSLLWLLEKLVSIYGIDPRNIIGHSDVATKKKTKHFCPGLNFDWARLERNGFGIKGPSAGYPSVRNLLSVGSELYGGLFKGTISDPVLELDDNDNRRIYGGKHLPNITGTPILDLVTDLQSIGYWVGGSPSGRLTNDVARAATHFQFHFFARERLNLKVDDKKLRIDAVMAGMIRDISQRQK